MPVRGGEGRGGDVRSLFTKAGDRIAEEMSFLAEMIIRATGKLVPPAICVVPMRMQEAWLLFDENALRKAAGALAASIP